MHRFVLPRMGLEFMDAWNVVVAISARTAPLAVEFWIRAPRTKTTSRPLQAVA